jgi:hypothetical protein
MPVFFGLEVFIAFRRFAAGIETNHGLLGPSDHARHVMHQAAPLSARGLSGGVTASAGHSHVPGSSVAALPRLASARAGSAVTSASVCWLGRG